MQRERHLETFGLYIQEVEGCGRGVFARRDFEVGEIVLKEKALISLDLNKKLARFQEPPDAKVPEEKKDNFRIFVNYMKKLETFLMASSSQQESMLDCYCGDDLEATDPLVTRARSVVNFCSARESICKNQDLRRMCRGILAFDLNSWGVTDSETKCLSELSIFDIGSKINHSCLANTATDGAGTHRALRRISKGTQITTDYLGQHVPKATHLRRMELWRDKRFWCRCELCSSRYDKRRRLPCPNCKGGTILPQGSFDSIALFPNEEKVKLSFRHAPPLPLSVVKSFKGISWTCKTCKKEFENSSSKIFTNSIKGIPSFRLETHLESKIEQIWFRGGEITTIEQLLNLCTTCLGTHHWIQRWCLHAYIRVSLLNSSTSSNSILTKKTDRLLDELLRWYKEQCGEQTAVYCLQSCMTLLSKHYIDLGDFEKGRCWYIHSLPYGRVI